MAATVDMAPGVIHWTGVDCHVYANHSVQVGTAIARTSKALPELTVGPEFNIFDPKIDHVELSGYDPHPAIAAEVAV